VRKRKRKKKNPSSSFLLLFKDAKKCGQMINKCKKKWGPLREIFSPHQFSNAFALRQMSHWMLL
jgi:hypothetical protein